MRESVKRAQDREGKKGGGTGDRVLDEIDKVLEEATSGDPELDEIDRLLEKR